jgi:plasmid stabilization system protein ParE
VTRYGLVIVADAAAQIRTIDSWWRRERPAAPDLFRDELDRAMRRLLETPGAGTSHVVRDRPGVTAAPAGVRRLRLARSRHHLYYAIDEETHVVTVLAVWHASRGAGPSRSR